MRRHLLAVALGAAAVAAIGAARGRRCARAARTNGGSRERTERLRRDIEAARERLREDLARMRHQ